MCRSAFPGTSFRISDIIGRNLRPIRCTFLDGLPAGPEDAFVSLPITSDTQVNNE